MMLTLLAIDPGLAECGTVIIQWPGPTLRPNVTHMRTIRTKATTPLVERFRFVCTELRALGDESIAAVACEEQVGAHAAARRRGQTNDDALYVREVVGAVRMLATELGKPFYSVSPLELRAAVGVSANASKQELRARLEFLLGIKLSSLHVSDAAAAAFAAKRMHQLELVRSRGAYRK